MAVRIDGNRQAADVDAAAARPVETARKPGAGSSQPATRQSDRLEVSAGAQLLHQALKVAAEAPAVRQDVVERARQALEAGQIGQDSHALADALIDDLLNG